MGRINRAWIERYKAGKFFVPTALKSQASKLTELPDDAQAFLESVNDTADNARNLFVTYILLAVYVFLTVGATNDEQLLRDSSVAVPFLSNINLPVSRFYQFVPWMFLFVHVDLLLLFKLMADKLHAFNAELGRLDSTEVDDLRQQLAGLPFIHWLSGGRGDGFSHFVTGLVVWSTLLALPLLTLLALQIGFLPYHSAATTFTQKLALTLDSLALIWFWPRLAAGTTESVWRWWLLDGIRRTGEPERIGTTLSCAPDACRGFCRIASAGLLTLAGLFAWGVAVLPGERLEDDGLVLHWLLDDVPAEPPYAFGMKLGLTDAGVPWYALDRIEIELKNSAHLWIKPHLPLFHRNLDLHEKLLVANEPDLEILAKLQEPNLEPEQRRAFLIKVKGLDLQGRDLRFANLREAKLWKADLRAAKLRRANLEGAHLQEVNWG